MKLKSTYSKIEIHQSWESVYRGNPLQERFDDRLMDRIIRCVAPRQEALFLDGGCGAGAHTVRIIRRGFPCVGLDISEEVLHEAKRRIGDSRASLTAQALEELAFREQVFDVVHCRGVLTHIPDWEKALANLCRVLKPSGKAVILELNHRSLETAIVLFVRSLVKRQSEMIRTPGGLEFWSEENGCPFVMRIFDLSRLSRALQENGVRVTHRFATEFWDINRFPSGLPRNLAIRFNQAWFSLHLPASLSSGNAVIGVKEG